MLTPAELAKRRHRTFWAAIGFVIGFIAGQNAIRPEKRDELPRMNVDQAKQLADRWWSHWHSGDYRNGRVIREGGLCRVGVLVDLRRGVQWFGSGTTFEDAFYVALRSGYVPMREATLTEIRNYISSLPEPPRNLKFLEWLMRVDPDEEQRFLKSIGAPAISARPW